MIWGGGAARMASAAALIFCATAFGAQKQHGQKETTQAPMLDSFYIVTQAVAPPPDADARTPAPPAPAWTDTILAINVGSDGVDALKIQIEPATGPHCPPHAVVARAVERALPNETAQRLAGRHKLCAMNESDVAGVIDAAALDDVRRANADDLATTTIVASCAGAEKLFELPYPDTLRFHALGLADSHITALWKMAAEVSARAFGDDFSFEAATPAEDAARQSLAAKLAPAIRDGKYASGFGDSDCAFASCRDHSAKSALEGYDGVLDPEKCGAIRPE
jgi:hypothetical protein